MQHIMISGEPDRDGVKLLFLQAKKATKLRPYPAQAEMGCL